MKNFNLDYLYTNSQKWIEIDDKKDYETAKKYLDDFIQK